MTDKPGTVFILPTACAWKSKQAHCGMTEIDFISPLHKKTKRDYLARVNEFPKAQAARLAKQFDKDYWDGDRRVGYGGMRYDGRWRVVADNMARHYGIKPGDKILDVGCGKAFLLYDFTQAVPGVQVRDLRRILARRVGAGLEAAMAAETDATVRGFLDPETARRIAAFG